MELKQDPLSLVICGVGGQGNILIARLLGRIFAANGQKVIIGETFGAAQRGGSVYSSLRVSKKRDLGPLLPKGQADLILGLEPLETLRMLALFGHPQVLTLTNDQPIYPVGVLIGQDRYPAQAELRGAIESLSAAAWFVPATAIAASLGEAIMANIVMLGALLGSRAIGLDFDQVAEEVKKTVPKKKIEANLKALEQGRAAVRQ